MTRNNCFICSGLEKECIGFYTTKHSKNRCNYNIIAEHDVERYLNYGLKEVILRSEFIDLCKRYDINI